LPIVLLPRSSVNLGISRMLQPNGAPSVIVNNNGDCQFSRNMDCQQMEVSDEYVYEVLPVMTVEGLTVVGAAVQLGLQLN
jgi:hypothetical protein